MANRHLKVVHSAARQHAETIAALKAMADRVPREMRRVYDWEGTWALDLFHAINDHVSEGMRPADIEEELDMPGLRDAYMDWLGGAP